jgi:AcrR family transcriptional regulator
MPLPRYSRLSPEKKERIIITAMKEFSRYHFQDASINRIIDDSGVSKGSMYYYFSDKADLYGEVLEQWSTKLLGSWRFDLSVETPEKFWEEWRNLYLSAYQHYLDNPESEAFARHFYSIVSSGIAPREALDQARRIRAFCQECLVCGQAIGAVRLDLPEPLLVHLFHGLYETFDRWVHVTYPRISEDVHNELSGMISDLLKRVLAPG